MWARWPSTDSVSGLDRVGGMWHDSNMCSTAVAGETESLVTALHGVLDALLGADLEALPGSALGEVTAGLVRAQHRLHAATLKAVAAVDTAGVASATRHRTTKRWLEHRTRLSAASACHLTETARTLRDHLPATAAELGAGRITPVHVSAITSVVRTVGVEHACSAEPILLDLARDHDPATVRRATAALFAAVDPGGAERALHDAYEKRGLQLSVVGDHGYLDGVLDLESTELLRAALLPLMGGSDPADGRTAPQRRADALLDVVKKHLDSEPAPTLGGHRPHLSVVIDADQLPPGVGWRGDAGLTAGGEVDGPAGGGSAPAVRGWSGVVSLPWTGRSIPAAAARRWACHAVVTPVVARLLGRPRSRVRPDELGTGLPGDPAWVPLALGRSQRTASAAQLKALAVRDAGCVHPGCSRTVVFCDAHHVRHWVDGGPTDLANLVLLCRHHHRTLHAGDWELRPDPGSPGLFWAVDRTGVRPAQTALDRSPPLLPAA